MHSSHRSHKDVVAEFSTEAQQSASTDRKIIKLGYDLQLALKPYHDQKEIVAKKTAQVKTLNEEVAEFKNMCNLLEGNKVKAQIRRIMKTTARKTLAEAKALSKNSHKEVHVMNERHQKVKSIEEQLRTRMKEIQQNIDASVSNDPDAFILDDAEESVSLDMDALLHPSSLAEQLQGNQIRSNTLKLEGDTMKIAEAQSVVISAVIEESERVSKNFETTDISTNTGFSQLSECVVPVSEDSTDERELKQVLTDAETADSEMFPNSQSLLIQSPQVAPKQQIKSPKTPKQKDSASDDDPHLESMISMTMLEKKAQHEHRTYQKVRETKEKIDASKFDEEKIINKTEIRLELVSGALETIELEMIRAQKNLTKADEDEKERYKGEIDNLKKHLQDLYFEKFLFTGDLKKSKDSPKKIQNWLKLKNELETRRTPFLTVNLLWLSQSAISSASNEKNKIKKNKLK